MTNNEKIIAAHEPKSMDERIKRLANTIADTIYYDLIGHTGIDRMTARHAAVSAANKAAQSLELDLRRDGE